MANKDIQKDNIMMGPNAAVLDPKAVAGFYSVDNLRAIKPQDLNDPKMFEKVAMFVRSVDDGGEGFRAKETLEILTALLDQNQKLDEFDAELLRNYFDLIVILKANCISLMQPQEVQRFLREQTLHAISISLFFIPEYSFLFDLKEKVRNYLKWDLWYVDLQSKKDILALLIEGVENNEEYLGETEFSLDGKPVEQIMKSWIEDYNRSAHVQQGRRSAFDKAKYLNNSGLVRTLDSQQAKILEKYLEFYDWLKFDAPAILPNKHLEKLNELVKIEDKGKKMSDVLRPVVQAPPVQPAPPKPVPRPVPKPEPKPVVKQAAPPPPQDLPIQMPKTLGASPDGVNVQKRLYKTDELDDKAGLNWQGAGNRVQGTEPANKKPDLDSKLEELKNKMKQNDARIEEKLKALKKKMGDK